MSNIWITIPSGKRRQYLNDIIKDSNIPKNQIVLVNTVECEPTDGVHNIWDLDPPNIQRWWNLGIDIARANGAEYIAVLNDDLRLFHDPINKIVEGMKKDNAVLGYPYPHTGNGVTGVAGYCWVLDLKTNIRADESFRWYFGDDDIKLRALEIGKVIYVEADVKHIHPLVSTNSNPHLIALTKIDKLYFMEKWSKRFKRMYKPGMNKEPIIKEMIKLGLNGKWVFPN